MAIPSPESRPGSGIKANDYIYPIFMVTAVPHILKGFLIVAILSAAMSSVSSALTSLASVSTMDFVKAITRSARSEAFYLQFSKLSTVVWAALLILVAYLSREVEYVLNAAFSLRGLTSGALLGSLLLVLIWKRGPAVPVVAGVLGAFVVMVCVSQITWTATGPTGEPTQQKVAWPWFTLIGTFAALGIAHLTRMFVRSPEPQAV
jgi:Na+/proline symporter